MNESKKEYIKRDEYGNRACGYHTVVNGCTDSLDRDELDLYRFIIGGMQGK